MKKASEVFKSIRFAKLDPYHDKGPKNSTDDEQHYTVGEKEFQQQIAHVKKRAMQEEKKDKYDEGEYDQEGDMAKSDLRSIIANAKRVHDMLEDSDNLPEWVQSKITKAEDYMSTVANYMEAEMNEETDLQESGGEVVYKKGDHHIEKYGEDSFALYSNGKKQKFYTSMKAAKEAMKEEVEQIEEISSDLVKKARDTAFQKGKDDQGLRLVRKAYEKGKKESDAMAKKINEVSADLARKYLNKVYDTKGYTGHSEKRNKGLERATNKVANAARMADYHTSRQKGYSTEEVEHLDEKNVPTSPEKWAQAKAQAKAKFDVYPSAYANGWAAKKYKEMGGGWKSVSEDVEQIDEILRQDNAKSFVGYAAKKEKDDLPFTPDKPKKNPVAKAGKYGMGYSTAKHLAKMAMKKQVEKLKKVPVKEESSAKAKIVKDAMKKKKSSSEDAFQAEPVLSSTVTKTQ